MNTKNVVFVHGLWLHASSWENWVELFHSHGYEAIAPSWPGDSATAEESRSHPELMNGVGIEQIVEHFATIIRTMPEKPIVIGHSLGGLIAQRLLSEELASAAIAIDPAPIKGVHALPFSAIKSSFPVLKNPFNAKRSVMLAPKQFRYGFVNTSTREEASALYERYAIPASGRPLFEILASNFKSASPAKINTEKSDRGPLLITAAGKDNTVPPAVSKSTFKLYKNSKALTEYHEFPESCHSLTIDKDWKKVAEHSLQWLRSKGF